MLSQSQTVEAYETLILKVDQLYNLNETRSNLNDLCNSVCLNVICVNVMLKVLLMRWIACV